MVFLSFLLLFLFCCYYFVLLLCIIFCLYIVYDFIYVVVMN
jgi:hypothetical protein